MQTKTEFWEHVVSFKDEGTMTIFYQHPSTVNKKLWESERGRAAKQTGNIQGGRGAGFLFCFVLPTSFPPHP